MLFVLLVCLTVLFLSDPDGFLHTRIFVHFI